MKTLIILKQKVKEIKNEVIALYFAYKNKRTPAAAKLMILLTIGYAVSPIDLISDFIPVLGYLDDLIILPVMIYISIRLIPEDVMSECRLLAKRNHKLNLRIGYVAAAFIILFWIIVLGFVIFKIVK